MSTLPTVGLPTGRRGYLKASLFTTKPGSGMQSDATYWFILNNGQSIDVPSKSTREALTWLYNAGYEVSEIRYVEMLESEPDAEPRRWTESILGKVVA